MSRPAKSLQSGLGAIKRDWSQSNLSQASQDSEIPWSSSPHAPVQPKPIDKHTEKKLTPSEIRLKAIQEALSGVSSSSSSKAPPPLAHSSLQNKRPSSYTNDATVPAPKRARQLPPDWHDSLTGQSLSNSRAPSTSSSFSKSAVLAPPSAPGASAKTKLASIFLSQEQTQILKLVQDGESVFYTGSAGKRRI
ncbi:hypothetical protein BJ912DRAFT_438109 [Pholiota molesta]|nr:hypothetical protein BJ912DRAFT_438109 [Pholiota molesta]